MKRIPILTLCFLLPACYIFSFDFKQAVGLQATVPGVTVPVASYWQTHENNVFTRGEAGFIYDGTHTTILLEVNGFNNFYEDFYAGLGFSAAYDNNSVILGICNPSVGFMFDILGGFKGFLETSVTVISLRKLQGNSTLTLTTGMFPALKLGVAYFFK
ncbi:MAG: hypothetical protein LLG37_09425 [Spirochaetia bacterium]|nr:hypothetical protein [Spirochaetia bacterium]